MSLFKDEGARNLLQQHMRECERARLEDRHERELAATEVARRLELHQATTAQMHEQNLSKLAKLEYDSHTRFIKVIWAMLTMTTSLVTGLALEVVKLFHFG